VLRRFRTLGRASPPTVCSTSEPSTKIRLQDMPSTGHDAIKIIAGMPEQVFIKIDRGTVALYALNPLLDRSPTRSARFDPQRNVELREPQEGRWTQRSTASVRLCARHFRMMC
jgi:hypothetical protein